VLLGSIISEIYICQTEPIPISGINLDILKIGYSKEASDANETEGKSLKIF
jgi:hypothetical protein